MCLITKTDNFTWPRLKLKKVHHVLKFNQSQWLKPYTETNTQKRIEAEKNNDKDGKALYKLMNNVIYGKAMENLRNRIYVKLVNKKKVYLKCKSKPNQAICCAKYLTII